jgi:Putative amidase domain
MKQSKFSSMFLLALLLPAWLLAQGNNADENKIKAKVRSFFNANKNVLLGQDPDAALVAEQESDDIKLHGKPELGRNKQVLDKLKTEGIEYQKGQIVDIQYFDFSVSGNTAKIFAAAQYKLHFKAKQDAPEFTQYEELREFGFVQEKNKWVMSYQKLYPFGLKLNTTPDDSLQIKDLPVNKDNPAGKTGKIQNPVQSEEEGLAANNTNTERRTGGPSETTFMAGEPTRIFGTYNKTAAASYATTYAYNYNTANYRTYTANDCTNFISQCLKAGGWADAGNTLTRTANTSWYYSSLGTGFTTYTWAGAHNHYFFHKESGRSTVGAYVSSLRLGDIMQVSFANNGQIDHTVIVSKEDVSGADYVSYHSTNTLNKPVNQFVSDCGAGAAFYVWLLKSTF